MLKINIDMTSITPILLASKLKPFWERKEDIDFFFIYEVRMVFS